MICLLFKQSRPSHVQACSTIYHKIPDLKFKCPSMELISSYICRCYYLLIVSTDMTIMTKHSQRTSETIRQIEQHQGATPSICFFFVFSFFVPSQGWVEDGPPIYDPPHLAWERTSAWTAPTGTVPAGAHFQDAGVVKSRTVDSDRWRCV